MANVRLIGGSHAGEIFQWDVEKDGPYIRLADMTNCDFGPPTTDMVDSTMSYPVETYRVEEMRYGSGHRHMYAMLEPMRVVDAMNSMWNGYQDSLKNGN